MLRVEKNLPKLKKNYEINLCFNLTWHLFVCLLKFCPPSILTPLLLVSKNYYTYCSAYKPLTPELRLV